MYLVSALTSQIHKLRPITFFSECTTKAMITIQGIDKESFLMFRLVKKNERKQNLPCQETSKAFLIIRMTGETNSPSDSYAE